MGAYGNGLPLHPQHSLQEPNTPRARYTRLNKSIENTQRLLQEEQDIGSFLRRLSHLVDGLKLVINPDIAVFDNGDIVPNIQAAVPPVIPKMAAVIPEEEVNGEAATVAVAPVPEVAPMVLKGEPSPLHYFAPVKPPPLESFPPVVAEYIS
ncbi:uncharacterized protein LOC126265862 [Aethina tumida]|uniref:uncharacterized protein LOC126265862 n=1 Tax=Aethina tumida TaxID=116153 RepID=UPI00214801F2|nr:uncharacterized protein LOC126265862 [Aethina tumida]